jgi:hypothetical protein
LVLAASFRKAWRDRLFPALVVLACATQASADVSSGLTDFKGVSIQRALCATREVSMSPDGRYLAAWSNSGFPGKGFGMFAPDSAIVDMPCVLDKGFVDACVIVAHETRASTRHVAWSPDSRTLLTVGPAISVNYQRAPAFSARDAADLQFKSELSVGHFSLDGFVSEAGIAAAFARTNARIDDLYADDDVIVSDIHLQDRAGPVPALFSRRSAFFARFGETGFGDPAPVSGIALGSSGRWLHKGREPFVLASGELVRVRDGVTVARGQKAVLDDRTGDVVAIYDPLEAVTDLTGPRPIRRPIARRPGELLLSYARTPSGSAQAFHFEAPFGDSRVVLERAGKTASLTCERAEHAVPGATITPIDLGTSRWPLPARWVRQPHPHGVIFTVLGGPGAEEAERDRLWGIDTFIEQGFDVVLLDPSGNLGDRQAIPNRLAKQGGAAIDEDARLIRRALVDKHFAGYRSTIFYGSSYGGMLAMAVMQAPDAGRDFDQYMLAAPWLRPRPPASWADSRGPVRQNVHRQEQWELAATGTDWSRPDDAFRHWAAKRAAALSCDKKIAIYYSRTDPTFSEADTPCRASDTVVITAVDRRDHTVVLAGADPWTIATLKPFTLSGGAPARSTTRDATRGR